MVYVIQSICFSVTPFDIVFFIARSSLQRCSVTESVLRNFAKFTGKHMLKYMPQPATLLKKRLWHRCFLANFVKFQEHLFYRKPPGDCFCTVYFSNIGLPTYIRRDLYLGWKNLRKRRVAVFDLVLYCYMFEDFKKFWKKNNKICICITS